MEKARRPRFTRSSSLPRICLTTRDNEILRFVHRHRFLRAPDIASLVPGSSNQILRRLQMLFHHGYLIRPRAQLDYYHKTGSRPIAYGLGSKGAVVLREHYGIATNEERWSDKNRAVGRMFLEHALFVSHVMVALELACRKAGCVRLLFGHDLKAQTPARKPEGFRWQVNLKASLKLGIMPDQTFALEFMGRSGRPELAYFFLEADRGTMPVIRTSLVQTSIYRKLLAYEATWSQEIHKTRFGFHRFRVVVVTSTAERLNSIVNACAKLERGGGLFLFAERDILANPDLLFCPLWQTGVPGRRDSLLRPQPNLPFPAIPGV